MSAAKMLQERAQAIEDALDGPQDTETVEALTEELAEISNALQKDGETIDAETPENRAANVGLTAKASRFVVPRKVSAPTKPWDMEADKKRNARFRLSSPKHF